MVDTSTKFTITQQAVETCGHILETHYPDIVSRR
jgi:hypothetical protein